MLAIRLAQATFIIWGATYFVLLVDGAHERSCWWQDFIDEDKDGFFRRELDALADDIDKLTDSEIGGYQVFLLVDSSNVGFLNLLANHLRTDTDVRPPLSNKEETRRLVFLDLQESDRRTSVGCAPLQPCASRKGAHP